MPHSAEEHTAKQSTGKASGQPLHKGAAAEEAARRLSRSPQRWISGRAAEARGTHG